MTDWADSQGLYDGLGAESTVGGIVVPSACLPEGAERIVETAQGRYLWRVKKDQWCLIEKEKQ